MKLNLTSPIPALIHPVWQRASITGSNKHPNGVDLLHWIKQISGTSCWKKSKIKATNIKETTTPTQGTLYCLRAAHLLSSDAKEADRFGRTECCLVIGSVQCGTETVSTRQR